MTHTDPTLLPEMISLGVAEALRNRPRDTLIRTGTVVSLDPDNLTVKVAVDGDPPEAADVEMLTLMPFPEELPPVGVRVFVMFAPGGLAFCLGQFGGIPDPGMVPVYGAGAILAAATTTGDSTNTSNTPVGIPGGNVTFVLSSARNIRVDIKVAAHQSGLNRLGALGQIDGVNVAPIMVDTDRVNVNYWLSGWGWTTLEAGQHTASLMNFNPDNAGVGTILTGAQIMVTDLGPTPTSGGGTPPIVP